MTRIVKVVVIPFLVGFLLLAGILSIANYENSAPVEPNSVTTTHPSQIQEGEYGDNWVQTLPEMTRNFPIPRECQTEDDAGFIVHEDNSIEIAVPGGCVFDPDTLEWRKPIR